MKANLSMNTTDVIATCSLVVAALAFISTTFQLWSTHRHNKLSVRPLLTWHIARRAEKDGTTIAYVLRNHGLGPAVVNDRYFSKDAVRFKPPQLALDEVTAFVAFALGTKVPYQLKSYGLPGIGAAVPSQGEVTIGELFFPGVPPDRLAVVEELAGEVHFHVEYESMYGEKYSLSSAGRGP